jgi:predicted phosphodiesterase
MRILLLNDTHRGFSHNTDKVHRKFFKALEKLDFDVVVHAGDMTANKQKGVKKTFETLRAFAGHRPVLAVRGNHDYWQDNERFGWLNFFQILEEHKKWATASGIVLLDEKEIHETESVLIAGYSSWYRDVPPKTNDHKWMDTLTPDGQLVGSFLQKKEHQDLVVLQSILLENKDKTRVVVAHMPCFGEAGDQAYTSNFSNQMALENNCEFYLCGHSHKRHDGIELFGAKIYQSGSDYDKPNYSLIEV